MYVTDERKDYGEVPINRLNIGETFVYERRLYIKLSHSDVNHYCHCFELCEDTPWEANFDSDDKVTPVEIDIKIIDNKPTANYFK